jgi:hypothetical protein
MRRAALVLVLALGCGVKAAPLPPLRESAPVDGGTPAAPPPSSPPSTRTAPPDGGSP